LSVDTTSFSPKKVLLAMQGGAAFGAFGWGVLDRLLADERLEIEGVSGTSSGAVNAAVLTYGLIGNDRDRARKLLGRFWQRISEASESRRWGRFRSLRLLGPKLLHIHRKEIFLEVMSRILLPYNYNPLTMDPLRAVIDEIIDFERLASSETIKLFVNATNVATGKNRVFSRQEISLDALCASCCLPFLFDAVAVDGQRYWDGGYMGNPTIYPLIYNCSSHDIVLVLTSPVEDKAQPGTAAEILNRVSEVSFTAALVREMRAIGFVTNLIAKELVSPEAGLRKVNVHIIAPSQDDSDFGTAMNFSADWAHIERMQARGRNITEVWLQKNFQDLGRRSTVDLEALFG
jgi:NTE family protein